MVSRCIVLLLIFGLSSAETYNITLSEEELSKYYDSGIDIVFGDMLKVYCTSDQSTYALYNLLDEEEYNDCTLPIIEEHIEIGHCYNSILTISVKSSGGVNGVVDYQIGNSYYFGLYESNGDKATGKTPCTNGYKFSLNVVSEIIIPELEVNISTSGYSQVGLSFNMTCSVRVVEGLVQQPNVTWMKMDDVSMGDLDDLNIPTITVIDGSVTNVTVILDPVLLEHRGVYICHTSIVDIASEYILLLDFPPFTVDISRDYSGTLYAGDPLTLTCTITLNNLVDIPVIVTNQWTSDMMNINESSITETIIETDTNRYTAALHFYPLSANDDGEYKCIVLVVTNTTDSYINSNVSNEASTEVTVELEELLNCKNVTFLPRSVTITWTEPERAVQEGYLLGYYLQCETFNSHELVLGVNISAKNSLVTNYTINFLTPYTSYVCVFSVLTMVGLGPEMMCEFETAQDVPEDVPESFFSSPAIFSITFSWLPPSLPNGIIIQYNLTVCNINTGVTTTYIINSSQESYIVDFTPSQRYNASLSAGTVAGYGPPAYESGRTAPNIPGAAIIFNTEVLNASSVQLTWLTVSQQNINITHYIVSVSLYEGREIYNRDVNVSSVIVNGFVGEVPHVATVKAFNDLGQVILSNQTLVFTEEDVPPTPTNISVLRLNGTHMNISWSLIPITEARGIIQSYLILYQPNDDRKRQIYNVSVPATDSSVVIGGLDPGKSYSVSISASTNAGQGTFTSVIIVYKPESSLFQLRAGPFTSCGEWSISTEDSIKSFIRSAVVDTVTDYCDCGFLDILITNEILLCDIQNQTQAVYRAQVFNFGSISSTQIVSWIEDWVLNGASVIYGSSLVTFDPTCPVPLNSINDEICQLPIAIMQSTSNLIYIAGGVSAAGCILVISCIVVIVIVTFSVYLKFKKGRYNAVNYKSKSVMELLSNKAFDSQSEKTLDSACNSLKRDYETVDAPEEMNVHSTTA